MKTKDRPLGAVPNLPDHRDIVASAFQAAVTLDPVQDTDISMLPVQDQKKNGSCVGQAEGTMVAYFEYLETGKVVDVSRRFIYGRAKALDGLKEEGTYPRVAAKIITDEGAATAKTVPNDNALSHDKYIGFEVTDEVKADAYPRRTKGFADVIMTAFYIRQALQINKLMTISLQVGDWDGEYVKPTYKDGSNRGWHRVIVRRAEVLENGDIEFTFRNSWGLKWGHKTVTKKGDGKFLWSDYEKNCRDGLVYTDIPNELIEDAKQKPYQFTRDLQKGSRGTDVIELQKRLFALGFFDDKDGFTTYYGVNTENAVKKYQTAMGIVSSGTPATTGFGRFGQKTRAAMNEELALPPTFELKPIVKRKAEALIELMQMMGTPIKITDAYRSKEEQDALYKIGRTVQKDKPTVTNAKGGYSFHQWRVAFDVVFVKKDGTTTYEGDWDKIGRVGELVGLEWGGRWASFPDRPHFQYTAGYAIEDFIESRIDESRFN